MLWTILVILVVLWLLDLVTNVSSSLICALLVIAVGMLIYSMFSGRRVAL